MSQKKKGARWLNRNLIVSPIYIGLCRNEDEYHHELKRIDLPRSEAWPEFIPGEADATTHIFKSKSKYLALVCIKKCKDKTIDQIQSLLVHEAVHVWQIIKEEIGEQFPSREFEAYSIQGISQSLFQSYKEN